MLKLENLATSGGEAKQRIADGNVQVNNEPETRKRRKIVDRDIIEIDGERYQVRCQPALTESDPL
ncbi:MAG: RNA-binding S4 domain-containing protein [Pseudomonadota bacterium]